MDNRAIGGSGLAVSPLTFGGNIFGWTVDREQSFRLLDAFVDHGFNSVDTADVYSVFGGTAPGASETVIGEWLAQGGGRRGKVVLATKFGLDMGPGLGGQSAAYVAQAVEASLRRLRTDHIDLYILHWDDGKTPAEETLGALGRLVEQGKIREVGASNFSPERLADSYDAAARVGVAPYRTLQPLYNLYDRAAFEGPLRDVCLAHGTAVFPYFSLASGFLTGKYRSKADLEGSNRAQLVERFIDERGLRILAAMDAIAAERDITHAQIALAWLLAQPAVTSPVVSATTVAQLERTLAAVDVSLTAQDLAALDAASAID